MKKLKVICIGAGGRGRGYFNIMNEQPDNSREETYREARR